MTFNHGGKRAGAGRPVGGKYGEPTKSIRIPLSREYEIRGLLDKDTKTHSIPVYLSKVQAGFPSPAEDYIERYLDLNHHLIKHPAATFVVTATGESMVGAGIYPGDMLLVDKSLDAQDGSIVIAAIDGELTVKRLSKRAGRVQLLPENPKFNPIDIHDECDLVIWGVVICVIRMLEP